MFATVRVVAGHFRHPFHEAIVYVERWVGRLALSKSFQKQNGSVDAKYASSTLSRWRAGAKPRPDAEGFIKAWADDLGMPELFWGFENRDKTMGGVQASALNVEIDGYQTGEANLAKLKISWKGSNGQASIALLSSALIPGSHLRQPSTVSIVCPGAKVVSEPYVTAFGFEPSPETRNRPDVLPVRSAGAASRGMPVDLSSDGAQRFEFRHRPSERTITVSVVAELEIPDPAHLAVWHNLPLNGPGEIAVRGLTAKLSSLAQPGLEPGTSFNRIGKNQQYWGHFEASQPAVQTPGIISLSLNTTEGSPRSSDIL